jgi:hypothetical protein
LVLVLVLESQAAGAVEEGEEGSESEVVARILWSDESGLSSAAQRGRNYWR